MGHSVSITLKAENGKSRRNSEDVALDMKKVKNASESERIQNLVMSRMKKPFDTDIALEKEHISLASSMWYNMQSPIFSTSKYETLKKGKETFFSFFCRK